MAELLIFYVGQKKSRRRSATTAVKLLRLRPGPALSFFCCPIRRPKRQERIPPTRSARPHLLPNIPPDADAAVRLVVTSSCRMGGGHLRLVRRPPLYFLWVPFRRPKQRNKRWRAQSQASNACTRLMGSCGAAVRVYGGYCHGERGQNCSGLGGFGRRLILVLCVRGCLRRKRSFLPRNVTLVCGFVLSISNIFLRIMSTGGDTKHHRKYYQKPHLCKNSYRFLFWHSIQTPFVLFQ